MKIEDIKFPCLLRWLGKNSIKTHQDWYYSYCENQYQFEQTLLNLRDCDVKQMGVWQLQAELEIPRPIYPPPQIKIKHE